MKYFKLKRSRIKVFISLIFLLSIFLFHSSYSFAELAGHFGGITGDPLLKSGVYEYEEITFVTGEAVLLKGTITIPSVDETKESYTMSYTYEAQNIDKNIVLSRKVTYEVVNKYDKNLKQTVQSIKIIKFDENYTVDGDKYNLGSYIYDESKLIDNTPAVDYYSGNIYSKRVFYKNGDNVINFGKFTIESNTESYVGYKHKWGLMETMILNQHFEFEYPNPNYDSTNSSSIKNLKWTGDSTLKISSNEKLDFYLNKTDPQNISFRKNYVETKSEINVLGYEVNLPKKDNENFLDSERLNIVNAIRRDVILNSTSKIAPKIKDIGGNWAEDNIFLLASLGIYDRVPNYFMANLPISRIEFAKEITRAITDELNYLDDDEKLKQELILRQRPNSEKTNNFLDIDNNTKESFYTSYVKEKGIMNGIGISGEYFKPYRTLTRAQAITMMIRALGLSELSPIKPYTTKFKDDDSIPLWAKDYIYVANEIGLVTGYPDGNIRANSEVTKAEASALLVNFIKHLKDNITSDYREKVMNMY